MKFDELRLLVAVNELRKHDGIRGVDGSFSDRKSFVRRVQDIYVEQFQDSYFPWSIDEVCHIAISARKNTATQLKADIAFAHGYRCFWEQRGKGPCSEDVEAGHVAPASDGHALTIANGMIECRAHNNQRRARSIEVYLLSQDKTAAEIPY